MHEKKNHFPFKDFRHFIRDVSEIRSQDPQRQAEAIQKATDDLRQVAKPGREMQVDTFEDILKDVAEALRGWPKYSGDNDKKIVAGFLAFNFLLFPLIVSWTKPYTSSQIIALSAVIISIVFNVCYLAMLLTQERLHIEANGCLLSVVQLIIMVGTIIVVVAMLWYIFPPAVIVFLLASLVAFLIWDLFMFRGVIIAAHIRRVPPPQQNAATLSPTPQEDK